MPLSKAFGKLSYLIGMKARAMTSNRERLKLWERIYWEYFGMKIDLGGISIPKYPNRESRWWLVVVAQGLTIDRAWEVCRENFSVEKRVEERLDEIIRSDRSSENGTYAVWAKGNHGPDKKYANYSASDLSKDGFLGMTLLERLLFEILYHEKIKIRRTWRELQREHPDTVNCTLCLGSRRVSGHVPFIERKGGNLIIRFCAPEEHCVCIRPREIVLAA